jgi:hypothetical protein
MVRRTTTWTAVRNPVKKRTKKNKKKLKEPNFA